VHNPQNAVENAVNYTIQFITRTNRHQTYFSMLEEQVATDNTVRLVVAFVDKLAMQKLGFTNTVHKSAGRVHISKIGGKQLRHIL
jgi:DNA gyrase/topoisomerase IV subunit B